MTACSGCSVLPWSTSVSLISISQYWITSLPPREACPKVLSERHEPWQPVGFPILTRVFERDGRSRWPSDLTRHIPAVFYFFYSFLFPH